MVDLGKYIFKDLNTRKSKPEEQFTDAYLKGVYELAHVRAATKQLRVILDAKYKKSDVHKVMETQCQRLTITQHNYLLKLLHQFEKLFDETLGTQKTYPVDFEQKQGEKTICLQPYPVPNIHEEISKNEV